MFIWFVVPTHVSSNELKKCSEYNPDYSKLENYKLHLIEYESKKLREITQSNTEGILLVDVFNGNFPLPVRYQLLAGVANNSPYIRFASPPIFRGSKALLLKSLMSLGGSVSIGMYDEYKKRRDKIKSKQVVIFNCILKDFSVKLLVSPDFPNIVTAFINTEKEYIEIIDTNLLLWRELIILYYKLNKKEI